MIRIRSVLAPVLAGVTAALAVLVSIPAAAQTYTPFALKFGRAGGGEGTFGDGPAEFFDPEKVAVDASGGVWVADVLNHRIQKFDAVGTFEMAIGSFGTGNGQFNSPRGLAIDDAAGEIYVVDSLNDRIQVFDRDGAYLRGWGSTGSGDGQFDFPRCVALGAGEVYVTDMNNHRVQVFTAAGVFVRKWGKFGAGNGEFQYPRGIAVGPGGRILVVDSFNHRVQRFDPDGTFVMKFGANGGDGSFGTGNGQFNTPRDVSVAAGKIWVADTGNDRVQAFTDGGTTVTFNGITGAKGLADGLMNTPRGVTAVTGAQYVADSGNHRIDAFGAPALLRSLPPTSPEIRTAPGPGETSLLPFEVELLPLGADPRDLTALARFQLARDGHVRIVLEDAAGRELRVVHDAQMTAGVHEVTWATAGLARSAGTQTVSCRLETQDARAVRSVPLP